MGEVKPLILFADSRTRGVICYLSGDCNNMRHHHSIACFALVFSFIVFGVCAPRCSAADEKLTNASILELQGLNLGDGVIIEKIKASKCDFDTSIAALKQLKEA